MKQSPSSAPSSKRRFVQVLCLFFLAASLAFIFLNSLRSGAVSNAQSEQVAKSLGGLLGRPQSYKNYIPLLRKLGHFAEFALLGFWMWAVLRAFGKSVLRHISWPLLGGLLAGLVDETIQLGVPGRSSQVTDVLIDFAGVIAGLGLGLLLSFLWRRTLARAVRRGTKRE